MKMSNNERKHEQTRILFIWGSLSVYDNPKTEIKPVIRLLRDRPITLINE